MQTSIGAKMTIVLCERNTEILWVAILSKIRAIFASAFVSVFFFFDRREEWSKCLGHELALQRFTSSTKTFGESAPARPLFLESEHLQARSKSVKLVRNRQVFFATGYRKRYIIADMGASEKVPSIVATGELRSSLMSCKNPVNAK